VGASVIHRGLIAQREFPQVLRPARQTQDVVTDLIGDAQVASEVGQRVKLGGFGAGKHRGNPDRPHDQRAGLMTLDIFERVVVDRFAGRFEVHELAADDPGGSGAVIIRARDISVHAMIGNKVKNAARATEFSKWLKTTFLTELKSHPNIYIWDFREIVMDPDTNFLKYEYESEHNIPDSHPNNTANNNAGPQFAEFIVDSIANFYGNSRIRSGAGIIFLHHSVGLSFYD